MAQLQIWEHMRLSSLRLQIFPISYGDLCNPNWDPADQDGFQYYLLERSTDEEFTEETVSNYVMSNYFEDSSLEYDTEYFYIEYLITRVIGANYQRSYRLLWNG